MSTQTETEMGNDNDGPDGQTTSPADRRAVPTAGISRTPGAPALSTSALATKRANHDALAAIDRYNWRRGKPSVTLGFDAPERCAAPTLRVVEKR